MGVSREVEAALAASTAPLQGPRWPHRDVRVACQDLSREAQQVVEVHLLAHSKEVLVGSIEPGRARELDGLGSEWANDRVGQCQKGLLSVRANVRLS